MTFNHDNECREIKILDHGFVRFVEHWGSDERVVESARMSTQKGFEGWGPKHRQDCVSEMGGNYDDCSCGKTQPGDEKLLRYLWENAHTTPFEMAGMVVEVQAPIFVFREWQRHRTFSFNEMSARFAPLPDLNYVPTIERLLMNGGKNKQAGKIAGAGDYDRDEAGRTRDNIQIVYGLAQETYDVALKAGCPKELARLVLPVGRYSRMRAQANLRNWLAFLTLRDDPKAQWEIREYAKVVRSMLTDLFPRTLALFSESRSR